MNVLCPIIQTKFCNLYLLSIEPLYTSSYEILFQCQNFPGNIINIFKLLLICLFFFLAFFTDMERYKNNTRTCILFSLLYMFLNKRAPVSGTLSGN